MTDMELAELARMARDNPMGIIALLDASQPPHILTFVAEYAGECPEAYYPQVKALLVGLMGHPSKVVREGAKYGLMKMNLGDG
jgi:hypothetical protein